MIMKANKQIGFIYKDNESIDKILKNGEVVFERGFLREKTSTTLPITFGGIGKDLKDYKVYGNTYQNTTSGKNLLDDKNMTARLRCTVDNGVITTTPLARASTFYVNINDIPLKAGDELYTTFKVRLKSGTASILSYGGRLYNGTTYATNTRITNNRVSNEFVIYSVKQTVSTDIIANQMVFQAENTANVSDAVYEIKDIIVSTNPIDTYEEYTGGQPSPNPDYPQEMVSCGDLITDTSDINYGKYKIPVNVRSENLFDKDNANVYGGYLSGTGVVSGNGNPSNYDNIVYIECKPNTAYVLKKMLQSDTANNRFRVGCTSEIPVQGIQTTNFFKYNDGTTETQCVYTTSSTAKYLLFYCGKNSNTTSKQQILDSIMIVEGSIAPSKYIPYYNETTNIYLDEPLRKIDGYSDYIDFINGKAVRNIKEYTLIGDEQIKMIREGMNCIKIDGKNIRTESLTMPPIFCNMLLANSRGSIYQGNVGIGYGAINNEYYNDIVMRVPNITTLTDFTTWLQSNNVTVDYVLATPTEESITLPNISTIDGNNTLNIETEITPSQVYIKYKSNE